MMCTYIYWILYYFRSLSLCIYRKGNIYPSLNFIHILSLITYRHDLYRPYCDQRASECVLNVAFILPDMQQLLSKYNYGESNHPTESNQFMENDDHRQGNQCGIV